MLVVKVPSVARCPVNCLAPREHDLPDERVEEPFRKWTEPGWSYPRILKNSLETDVLAGGHIPDEAAGWLTRCAVDQFGSLRRSSSSAPLAILDVGGRPVPFDNVALLNRTAARLETKPAIFTIEAPQRASSSPDLPDARIALHFTNIPFLSSG